MLIFQGKAFTAEGMERKGHSKRKGLSRNSGESTIHIRWKTRKEQETEEELKDIEEKGLAEEED